VIKGRGKTDLHIVHIIADLVAILLLEQHRLFPAELHPSKTLLLLDESEFG